MRFVYFDSQIKNGPMEIDYKKLSEIESDLRLIYNKDPTSKAGHEISGALSHMKVLYGIRNGEAHSESAIQSSKSLIYNTWKKYLAKEG